MLTCRIDTANRLEYFQNGGVLHYVLRNLRRRPERRSHGDDGAGGHFVAMAGNNVGQSPAADSLQGVDAGGIRRAAPGSSVVASDAQSILWVDVYYIGTHCIATRRCCGATTIRRQIFPMPTSFTRRSVSATAG